MCFLEVYLSHYSPDFNLIEHGHKSRFFYASFLSPQQKWLIRLIATALDSVNPKHLRNCFALLLLLYLINLQSTVK